MQDTCEDLQKRRLTRAISSNETNSFSFTDSKGYTIKCKKFLIVFFLSLSKSFFYSVKRLLIQFIDLTDPGYNDCIFVR